MHSKFNPITPDHDITFYLTAVAALNTWQSNCSILGAVHGFLAAGQLVWEHTTHYTPQDLARSTEMVWAMGGVGVGGVGVGVGVHTLAQKLHVLQFVSVEASRDVDLLTS